MIDHIDPKRRQITVLTDDGRRVQIPFAYAAGGYLTHGYATTIHKAQGATVDRASSSPTRPPAGSTPTPPSPEAATATTSICPPTTAEYKKATPPRSTPTNSTAYASRSAAPSGSTSPPTSRTNPSSRTPSRTMFTRELAGELGGAAALLKTVPRIRKKLTSGQPPRFISVPDEQDIGIVKRTPHRFGRGLDSNLAND